MNVKVTVNINDKIWDKFTQMVEEEELSRTYAINEALSDWVLIERMLRDKYKILLDNGSNIIKELERRPNGRGKK